jgi:hypothetical protein
MMRLPQPCAKRTDRHTFRLDGVKLIDFVKEQAVNELMERHFRGETLREVADASGVSHQTIATDLREAKREHLMGLAMELLIACRTGDPLWLLVPATSGPEVAQSLRYLSWVIDELEGLTFKIGVEVVQKADGIAFGLTDTSRGGSSS